MRGKLTRGRWRQAGAGLAVALLVFTLSNTLTSAQISFPPPNQLPPISELPDPFRFINGTRVSSPSDWSARRAAYIQHYEYGSLPPPPTSVTGTRNGNTLTVTVQANGRTASFNATLRLPSGNGPFPAFILLNGLAASATNRGYAEVQINPPDIAADSTSKTGAFWTLYNGTGVDTGVLMAWAWGVHRTLDALRSVPQIDTTKVGVSGYSRYGKAALVAGAFDERLVMTVPGSSGTAGMGDYRFFFTNGSNDETLNDIAVNEFPYWFTPLFGQFGNQVTRLPFDQHALAALVAPRLLLATNGTDGTDVRTNPQGAGLVYRGAKMVYQFLGVPDRIGIAYRPGGHQIDINDYNAIMDFADKFVKGLAITRTFDSVPYPAPTTAQIPWTAPSSGPTATRTNTPPTGPTNTPTNTPTTGPSPTPTRTPTPGQAGTCSPVAATITAPFTFDGAGTLCWRSSNLGNNINNWNLASLTVNGVDFTSKFAFTSNLPPKAADGFWYISYTGNFPWSHFEAR
jgi:hypothetical protein